MTEALKLTRLQAAGGNGLFSICILSESFYISRNADRRMASPRKGVFKVIYALGTLKNALNHAFPDTVDEHGRAARTD